MSHSKQTEILKLPIFEPNDKPAWLGEWNETMSILDKTQSSTDAEFNKITTRIDAQDQQILTLGENVNTALTHATNAETKISTEIEPRLATNETAIKTNETNITNLTTELNNNVTTLKNEINNLATSITCAELSAYDTTATITLPSMQFVTINFDKKTETNEGQFTLNSNALVCNFDGWILVSGAIEVLCGTDSDDLLTVQLFVNDNWVAQSRVERISGASSEITGEIASRLVQVTQGDRLYMKARLSNGGTAYARNRTSHLTIHRVK